MFSSLAGPSFPNHLYTVAAQSGGVISNPNALTGDATRRPSATAGVMAPTATAHAALPRASSSRPSPIASKPPGVSWRYYAPRARAGRLPLVGARRDRPHPEHVALDRSGDERRSVPRRCVQRQSAGGELARARLQRQRPSARGRRFGNASVCEGENWTVNHINAIMQGGNWPSTVIVLLWDDFGGFYDHVPPPTSTPTGSARVCRCIVISPYVKEGTVSHTVYEVGSVLQLIENRYKLKALTPSATSRRTACSTCSTSRSRRRRRWSCRCATAPARNANRHTSYV